MVRGRQVLMRLLVVYGVAMLGVLLLPVGGLMGRIVALAYWAGQGLGMPALLTPRWYEFGLNMVLFAVPAALAVLVWPRIQRLRWLLLACVVSVAVELFQWVALPRTGDPMDVVANVSGAMLGLAAMVILGLPEMMLTAEPSTVQIHDVPEAVRSNLEHRAAQQGRSLNSYLQNELVRIAGPHRPDGWGASGSGDEG